jgi:microcystin-dependent protein
MESFIGQVNIFAFGFAPENWLPCDGRILSTVKYQMLFSLIGTTYGGDGASNFALPKLSPLGPKGPGYYIRTGGVFPEK